MKLLDELNLTNKLFKLGTEKTFISTKNTENIDLTHYIKDFMAKSKEKTEKYLRNNTLYTFLLELYSSDIVDSIINNFGYKGEFWVYSAYDALRAFTNDMNPDNVYNGLEGGIDQIIYSIIDKLNDNVTIIKKMHYNGYDYIQGKFIVNVTNKKTKELIDFTSDKLSIFPLATPLLAGPAAITSVIVSVTATGNDFRNQAIGMLALVAATSTTFIILFIAAKTEKILNKRIISVFSRIVAIILAGLSIQYILNGIKAFINL